MDWRYKKALQIIKKTVDEFNSFQFSPDIIKAKLVKEMDWYKYGKPIFDAFIAEKILLPIKNARLKTTGYLVNMEKLQEAGIEVENYLLGAYKEKLQDMKEKDDHETTQDIARLKLAEPEVKR